MISEFCERGSAMLAPQPKKLLIVNILDILKRYTDEEHRLSQREIETLLKTEYGMKAGRKAVRRNLMDLMEFGYEIEYTETTRRVKSTKTGEWEESTILTDFYLVHDFTDGELRLLIDGLLFSKHIPYNQCRQLVEKLEGLSNRYFRARVGHIRTLPDTAPENKQLFFTIETLDEAISRGRQVAFHYLSYGIDKKAHPRRNSAGEEREYIVNPYQMAAANGRYYLIGNYDKYDDVAHYRLDRIADIRMLDAPAKPARKVKWLENGFDLPQHMAEHVYMFAGESASVVFRLKKYLVSDVIDWFGSEIEFFDEAEEEVSARVRVNLQAMRKWAMQYAVHTKILSPQSLAEQVKSDLREAAKQYDL